MSPHDTGTAVADLLASGPNSEFVHGCYRVLLNREADSGGMAWGLHRLHAGSCSRGELMRSLFLSEERRLGNLSGFNFEDLLESFYLDFLQPGDQFIDIGAHLGRHALSAARRCGPSGRGLAFEPLPQICERLRQNVADAGDIARIDLRRLALSDASAADVIFTVAVDRLEESGLMQRSAYNGATKVESIKVAVSTLDIEWLGEPGFKPKFIKIDVEGAELQVLRGSVKVLSACRPIVAFESGGRSLAVYGDTSSLLFDFFGERRYTLFDLFGHELGRDEFVSLHTSERLWDYVAIPDETIEGDYVFRHLDASGIRSYPSNGHRRA